MAECPPYQKYTYAELVNYSVQELIKFPVIFPEMEPFMNRSILEKIRSNTPLKKSPPVFNVLRYLANNITKISLFLVMMGCFNLWFYLYRIDHLTLLPSMLTTPSTLLAISFALAGIIVAFFITLLMPAIFYLAKMLLSKEHKPDKAIIPHSFLMSFIISVTGVLESETANSIFIFIISGYCINLIFHIFYGNWRRQIKIYASAFLINVAFIIITLFIYNKADLSGIDRFYRFITIFLYMTICYFPIMAIYDFFNETKRGINKKTIISLATTFIIIFYVTLNITPGFFVRANDHAIYLAGLKSNHINLYKIQANEYPAHWFKNNWTVKYRENESIWVEGYAIFQNSNIKVICPADSQARIQKKLIEETTIFSRLEKSRGAWKDMENCIEIENKSGSTLFWQKDKDSAKKSQSAAPSV